MPKLFNIQGIQRLETGGVGRQARPQFLRSRAPEITRPTASARVAPVPVQMPNRVQMPNHKGPWDAIAKGTADFMVAYTQESTRIQDEKDRVDASEAARMFDDALRDITRGDHEEEMGYLFLEPREAVKRNQEYSSRVDATFKTIAEALSPNARRYAAEKMLGYRRVAMREIADHNLKSHRARQDSERQAQYQSFIRRLDDHGADVGAAMAEVASYTMTLPEDNREEALSGVISDYTNLVASKDPEVALPMLYELQDKAKPAFDVASQTNMNRRVAEVARRYNAQRDQKDAAEESKMKNFHETNQLQMYRDMFEPGGPDLNHYNKEVLAGRMKISQYNTLRRQWENREHLPGLTAEEEYQIRESYINGRIAPSDIYDLDVKQGDKDRLFNFMSDIEADERQAEIKYYYGYIGNMIKAKPTSRYMQESTKVAARNAQEAFRKMAKDPDNTRTLAETANHVLGQYQVSMTEYDKIPVILVPGGVMYRPKSRAELIEAVTDIAQADELGLLSQAESDSLDLIVNGYDAYISQLEEREAEAQKKEAEAKARSERGIGEKIMGLFGGGEQEETE